MLDGSSEFSHSLDPERTVLKRQPDQRRPQSNGQFFPYPDTTRHE
jgi:hypothetical protein